MFSLFDNCLDEFGIVCCTEQQMIYCHSNEFICFGNRFPRRPLIFVNDAIVLQQVVGTCTNQIKFAAINSPKMSTTVAIMALIDSHLRLSLDRLVARSLPILLEGRLLGRLLGRLVGRLVGLLLVEAGVNRPTVERALDAVSDSL